MVKPSSSFLTKRDITPRAGSPDQASVFHTHSQEKRRQYRMELAQRILANRERRGNDLVSVFSQGWDPFPPFIASLSADDWHKPCHHSFGIIPVHARVHAGVFELAIHSWKRNKKVAVAVVMICSPTRGTLEGAMHHGL